MTIISNVNHLNIIMYLLDVTVSCATIVLATAISNLISCVESPTEYLSYDILQLCLSIYMIYADCFQICICNLVLKYRPI